ncbi:MULTISPECIES: biofilm development regulator YmgB/AriR family protein [unclassified Pantoea]|uniref:biofilm development regulator YmgB/AriR family protein n=1 Tax=unclassified Pantoea TaxID=2630326 RepID=UPI00301BDCDF
MPTPDDIFSVITDIELAERFRNAGNDIKDESAVLGFVIRSLLQSGEQVTRKAIILSLIGALESVQGTTQADVLRRTLEIVVGCNAED